MSKNIPLSKARDLFEGSLAQRADALNPPSLYLPPSDEAKNSYASASALVKRLNKLWNEWASQKTSGTPIMLLVLPDGQTAQIDYLRPESHNGVLLALWWEGRACQVYLHQSAVTVMFDRLSAASEKQKQPPGFLPMVATKSEK